jgi:hypothetical protein
VSRKEEDREPKLAVMRSDTVETVKRRKPRGRWGREGIFIDEASQNKSVCVCVCVCVCVYVCMYVCVCVYLIP